MRRFFRIPCVYPIATAAILILALAATLAGSAGAQPACEQQDGPACDAEQAERVALYAKGRNAYDAARTSGDFSEALAAAKQLAGRQDKNGERLLKMVYLQLGWGAHQDYVQAYGWLSEGIAGGADYLTRWRQILADKMTPEQLSEAKKKAGNQAGQ